MTATHNIFSDVPAEIRGEFFQDILRSDHVRIERIVSHGEKAKLNVHKSPEGFWYDQQENEWVLLVAGTAELSFADGRRVALLPGDHLLIPAHTRHRVEKTDPEQNTIWLAVHF
jgi:cupin 2 domain-containing protein